jgi:hypothetical protein
MSERGKFVYSPVHLCINREKATLAYIKYNNFMNSESSKDLAKQVQASTEYFDDLEDAIDLEDE